MVCTKLDAMNYALEVLQEKYKDMEDKGATWRDRDLGDCRETIKIIARQAEMLNKEATTRKHERDEKWRRFFSAIKPYCEEWHTAFDLYTLVKDEIGDSISFSSFYSRLGQCRWCITSEKKGKQERVYKFILNRYKNEYGEI